jgi:hypothetical protein
MLEGGSSPPQRLCGRVGAGLWSSSRLFLIENSVVRFLIRQIDEGPHRS